MSVAGPRRLACRALLLALVAPGAVLAQSASNADSEAVRALIARSYDRPEARVETDPVVVAGAYAVAGWTQGERGGRAVLRKVKGRWTVLLCGGDGLKTAQGLRGAGVPETSARLLARDLASAERQVPAERLHRFGLFQAPDASHPIHPHH
ncbi:MAG: copper uptake system-associated protein [Azonexus sp.]|nr:copper uptake system-associated protein [Betaproteobacteria bacterium]MBK8919602.1 copper uptake system-associated protein [Betaproteobacteria bacterium]MBP6034843.1 copper uptake system-associated protein [Azonexus sp.]MBP6905549.1 copper uptake system-associated protein [Azonexus sp.]